MKRQAYSVFCDDIRQEIGGKQSLMGIYTSKMLVPAFPILLPKLCIVITALTPIEDPFKKLTFRVLKDEEVFSEGNLEESELAKIASLPTDSENGNHRIFTSTVQFVFSPFQLDEPCTLRIRVITENEEMRTAGLRIELGASS